MERGSSVPGPSMLTSAGTAPLCITTDLTSSTSLERLGEQYFQFASQTQRHRHESGCEFWSCGCRNLEQWEKPSQVLEVQYRAKHHNLADTSVPCSSLLACYE